MKNPYSIKLFVLLVFALPVMAFAVMNWYEKKVEKLPVIGKGEKQLSDFNLINQEGQSKSIAGWKNKIVVVNIFFSHCPVVCPKMMLNIKKVQQAFNGDQTLLFNSFTVDPQRDSAARLKEYAVQFGINTKNWNLLTGDKKELYKLARNSFMIVATDGDGGENDFIHSDKLVLIDSRLRIRGYYEGTSAKETNQLINDIKKLKNEN